MHCSIQWCNMSLINYHRQLGYLFNGVFRQTTKTRFTWSFGEGTPSMAGGLPPYVNGQQCRKPGVTSSWWDTVSICNDCLVCRFYLFCNCNNEQNYNILAIAQTVRHCRLYTVFYVLHLIIVTIRLKIWTLILFNIKPWSNGICFNWNVLAISVT